MTPPERHASAPCGKRGEKQHVIQVFKSFLKRINSKLRCRLELANQLNELLTALIAVAGSDRRTRPVVRQNGLSVAGPLRGQLGFQSKGPASHRVRHRSRSDR